MYMAVVFETLLSPINLLLYYSYVSTFYFLPLSMDQYSICHTLKVTIHSSPNQATIQVVIIHPLRLFHPGINIHLPSYS